MVASAGETLDGSDVSVCGEFSKPVVQSGNWLGHCCPGKGRKLSYGLRAHWRLWIGGALPVAADPEAMFAHQFEKRAPVLFGCARCLRNVPLVHCQQSAQ